MLTLRLLRSFGMKKNSSISSSSPKVIEDSNIIVDHMDFEKKDLISYMWNMLRNSNATADLNRNMDGQFKKRQYEKNSLQEYLTVYKHYENRNHRAMFQHLGSNLNKLFKSEVKKPKSEGMDLSWNLMGDATKSEIMMVRLYEEQLDGFRSADRWFQLTLKISNPEGKSTFNIMEKHDKALKFKFVKFDV